MQTDAILIDESHNFRNTTTAAYKALSSFMEDKTEEARIIMLSATPISNKLSDIKNQIALFPRDMRTRIPPLGQISLDEYFKVPKNDDGTVSEYGKDKIRELLKHIMIRRTRSQIKEKYANYDEERKLHYIQTGDEKNYFPKRSLENPSEYDIDKVYKNQFDAITNALKNLKLARYNPGKYIKEEYRDPTHPQFKKYDELHQSGTALVGIVRSSLLKRVESSIMAFHDSVEHYLDGHSKFNTQLRHGIIPIGKAFQDTIYRSVTDSDYDENEYKKEISEIEPTYESDAFEIDTWIDDIQSDTKEFAAIQGYLGNKSDFFKRDDKLDKLVEILSNKKDDKILIFSESASTARYIAEHLKHKEILEKIDHKNIEQIDSRNQKSKYETIWKFDPINNARNNHKKPDKEIDILVSTDILSEGVNLQSGRVVINYDFHWNPVRLIQRVGRVDRIGSRHDRIDVINFLPTTRTEKELGLKERVSNKITLIKDIMGSDQQILENTETFDANIVKQIYVGDESILDPENIGILSFNDTKAEKDSEEIHKDKSRLKQLQEMSFGIRSVTGTEYLLIACEAQEVITDENGVIIQKRPFREHYEVMPEKEPNKIWSSTFLERIGKSAKHTPDNDAQYDDGYNKLVAKSWAHFTRKIKYSNTETKKLTQQKHFEVMLRSISEKLGPDAVDKELFEFISRRMLPNHQPYKGLKELRDQVGKARLTETEILDGLQELYKKYSATRYIRYISKPQILYSMMVSK